MREITEQEYEMLRRKAARYDWLRHGDNDEVLSVGDCRGIYWPRGERMDEVIDRHLAEQHLMVIANAKATGLIK